jgi:hypothetical protein
VFRHPREQVVHFLIGEAIMAVGHIGAFAEQNAILLFFPLSLCPRRRHNIAG